MRIKQGNHPHRLVAVTTIATAMMIGTALPAAAQPTCADIAELDIQVHGQHVVRDYVTGGEVEAWPPSDGGVGQATAGQGAFLPGGPGPAFHFANDIPPGASFCNEQAQSPGSPGPR